MAQPWFGIIYFDYRNQRSPKKVLCALRFVSPVCCSPTGLSLSFLWRPTTHDDFGEPDGGRSNSQLLRRHSPRKADRDPFDRQHPDAIEQMLRLPVITGYQVGSTCPPATRTNPDQPGPSPAVSSELEFPISTNEFPLSVNCFASPVSSNPPHLQPSPAVSSRLQPSPAVSSDSAGL